MKSCRLIFTVFIIIIIILTNIGKGTCETGGSIPSKPDSLYFSMTHYIWKIRQKENYVIIKKGKDKIEKIIFERREPDGGHKEFRHTRRYPWEKSEDLIKLLNHLNFMNLKNELVRKNNFKSDTIFSLRYKYKGKTYSKTVRIQNIDQQIENPGNENAFKLKYLLLFIEFSEKVVYDDYLYNR